MSQTTRILAHLEKGRSITPIYALNNFGCMRLASRIEELRSKGYRINTRMVKNRSGARYASYSLVKK